MDDEAEEIFAEDAGTDQDRHFDALVGALEEILLGDAFAELQTNFCAAHCDVFEDCDENKLEYTPLFTAYAAQTEAHLEAALAAALPGSSMSELMASLDGRRDEITGDVFDLLLGLSDFGEFKAMMIAFKRGRTCRIELDGGKDAQRFSHK
ncbi:the ARF-like 2 binding protein BART-domain-containing protein [Pelagophyceae sp. CCMP2097]|nr:the ARF-like 2 binding protein BART-domain-containing protein [Pelagophyceae sp. CCMP2097]